MEIVTDDEHPGVEYKVLRDLGSGGLWLATFLAVFRMSLGDNDVGALAFMQTAN
jgi:hypothetical protein